MNNRQVAEVFENIADLLEVKGEISFKVRAYRRAAQAIDHLPQDIAQLSREDKLRTVPGVGEAIARKIQELVDTGRLEYYEKLRAEFPDGVLKLMEVPTVGPRIAARLHKELGITSVDALEQAILAGQVAALPRLGEKTAEKILKSIQSLRRKDQRIPLGQALPVVEGIMAALRGTPGLYTLAPAGSLRRLAETVGDVDLMGTAEDPARVLDAFARLPLVRQVLVQGPKKVSVLVDGGLQVDLRLVEPDSFGSLIQYFTGSKQHNIMLREWANRKGLSLSEYGITHLDTQELEKLATEEAFYQRLGLQYIPPELREGTTEVELAEAGRLPRLVELGDIAGDLHVHSNWSDGHASLEEMALAAQRRGYQYVALTDHSAGRGIAHGLNEERRRQQLAELRALDQRLPGIRILSGMEVDIRADGSLDCPDELMAQSDVVVAAVHSAMGQDRDRMTARVMAAMRSPHVDIVAHPTCRLLGERDPVDIDLEAVFQAALETGTALEINAMPPRLDLKDVHARRARDLGVKLVISTDSHSPDQLEFMSYGVGVARRAWCRPEDILNTRPLPEFLARLRL
ncbi:MAG: DNA polymerase/3'-5' exonuclease PolX [Chloroflexi bacterium]|nr:DNA polymerase/3'-5' exonuclease PolX [Chloroflexota bacterium]